MFVSERIEVLLPSPIYLLALLVALAVFAQVRGFKRRWRVAAWALAAWAWVLCTPMVANWLYVALEGDPSTAGRIEVQRDDASLVIVLSSGEMHTPSGERAVRLDVDGWERLVEGVRLWRRTGGHLLFTGGPPGEESGSIAALMAGVAVDMGVPRERIRLVSQSKNTYEDLSQARSIVAAHAGPVWLVTSALHMPRAHAVAQQLELPVRPYPVGFRQIRNPSWRSWLPNNAGPQRFAAALHELTGRWLYRWRGWAR
jgi:uncharacterized SAM-binding protein YcdF (DUF218 family)